MAQRRIRKRDLKKLALLTLLCVSMLLALVRVNQHIFRGKEAFVTLLTSDKYLVGVLVLVQSIKETNTAIPVVVLVTEAVSLESINQIELLSTYTNSIKCRRIESIENPNPVEKIGDERWKDTYTKLRVWELTEYSKIVFFDAGLK